MKYTFFLTAVSLALAPLAYGMEEKNHNRDEKNHTSDLSSDKLTVERIPGTNFFVLPLPTSQELQEILKDANEASEAATELNAATDLDTNAFPFYTSWHGVSVEVRYLGYTGENLTKKQVIGGIFSNSKLPKSIGLHIHPEGLSNKSSLMSNVWFKGVGPCFLENDIERLRNQSQQDSTWTHWWNSPHAPRLLCPINDTTRKLFNMGLPSLKELAADAVKKHNIATTREEGKDKTSLIPDDLKDFLEKMDKEDKGK